MNEMPVFVRPFHQMAELFGIFHHRPELMHLKGAAVLSRPFLMQEDRTGAVNSYGHRDDAHNGEQEGHREKRDENVEDAFDHALVIREGRRPQVEDGDAGEFLDRGVVQGERKVIGDDVDLDGQVVQVRHQPVDAFVRAPGQGEDDVIHLVFPDNLADVVERIQNLAGPPSVFADRRPEIPPASIGHRAVRRSSAEGPFPTIPAPMINARSERLTR